MDAARGGVDLRDLDLTLLRHGRHSPRSLDADSVPLRATQISSGGSPPLPATNDASHCRQLRGALHLRCRVTPDAPSHRRATVWRSAPLAARATFPTALRARDPAC